MKKALLLIVSMYLLSYANAQNLVPNPSFEDTVHCPQMIGDFNSGTNGISGLQFRKLTSTSATIPNPGNGVLTVDATGKVIYADLAETKHLKQIVADLEKRLAMLEAKINITAKN